MKPRFQIVISLSEQDVKKLEELKAKGIKIIEIFRKGLKSFD